MTDLSPKAWEESLCAAIRVGDHGLMERHFETDVPVRSEDVYRVVAGLMVAVEKGDERAVRFLVARPIGPPNDWEVLQLRMLAAANGRSFQEEILPTQILNHQIGDLSVIELAAATGKAAMVFLLDELGAHTDGCVDPDGEPLPYPTLLHHAAAAGQAECLSALVARYVPDTFELDARDETGKTPLMSAATEGHWGATAVLLAMGADEKATDSEGRTARQLATPSVRAEWERAVLNAELPQARSPFPQDRLRL